MDFLKCQDLPWIGLEKRNRLNVGTTTQKIPSPAVRFHAGSRQPKYVRSVSVWGKYSWGSRISASRSDVLVKVSISGDHKHRMNSIVLRYRLGLPLKPERRQDTRERRKSSLSRSLQFNP